jgi:hypothetical protein
MLPLLHITLSQPRCQRRGPLPTFAGTVASHPGIQTLHPRDVAVKVIPPPPTSCATVPYNQRTYIEKTDSRFGSLGHGSTTPLPSV